MDPGELFAAAARGVGRGSIPDTKVGSNPTCPIPRERVDRWSRRIRPDSSIACGCRWLYRCGSVPGFHRTSFRRMPHRTVKQWRPPNGRPAGRYPGVRVCTIAFVGRLDVFGRGEMLAVHSVFGPRHPRTRDRGAMRTDVLLRHTLSRPVLPAVTMVASALVLSAFSLAVVDVQQQLTLTLVVALTTWFAARPRRTPHPVSVDIRLRSARGAGPPVPFDAPITDVPRHPCRPRAPGLA